MHDKTVTDLRHTHTFGLDSSANEKSTLRVIILTAATMALEIITGMLTGSMALLADGWHMATHAFALGITYFAYLMARKFSDAPQFAFGTGKFGVLAGYTSTLFLGATALYMIVESFSRFIHPVQIAFNEAIFVAIAGLAVNVASMWMLGDHHHHHEHDQHEHDHHDHHHNHDHNLRAAYLHVATDALTSVLAIVALVFGKYLGWSFLDPVMGIVGGLLIGKWAWGLLKSTALILLDGTQDNALQQEVRASIEADGDSVVADLHIWPIDANAQALALTVVSRKERSPGEYFSRIAHLHRVKHITIETHLCADPNCDCSSQPL